MKVYTATDWIYNNTKIVGYRLLCNDGTVVDLDLKNIKMQILSGNLAVTNLKVTNDGRLRRNNRFERLGCITIK